MFTVPQRAHVSMLATVLHWWRRSDAQARPPADPDAYDRPPGLMVRRMARLGLDSQEMRGAEPDRFHRLQANCLLCPRPELCALALLDESIDLGWQDWRNYCPNATELSLLSTLNTCWTGLERTTAEPKRQAAE